MVIIGQKPSNPKSMDPLKDPTTAAVSPTAQLRTLAKGETERIFVPQLPS